MPAAYRPTEAGLRRNLSEEDLRTSLPHNAAAPYRYGTPVSRRAPRPGDLDRKSVV